MIALLAAMTMTAGQAYDRAKEVALALPPAQHVWVCEATKTKTYCCQQPAKIQHLYPFGFSCVTAAPFGFEDLKPAVVVERFNGDNQ